MWKSYKEASCCVRSPLALFTANGNSLLYGVTRASWKLLPFNDAIIYNLQSTLRSPPTLPHVCVCVCECVSILRFPPPSSIIHEAFFCTHCSERRGAIWKTIFFCPSRLMKPAWAQTCFPLSRHVLQFRCAQWAFPWCQWQLLQEREKLLEICYFFNPVYHMYAGSVSLLHVYWCSYFTDTSMPDRVVWWALFWYVRTIAT